MCADRARQNQEQDANHTESSRFSCQKRNCIYNECAYIRYLPWRQNFVRISRWTKSWKTSSWVAAPQSRYLMTEVLLWFVSRHVFQLDPVHWLQTHINVSECIWAVNPSQLRYMKARKSLQPVSSFDYAGRITASFKTNKSGRSVKAAAAGHAKANPRPYSL